MAGISTHGLLKRLHTGNEIILIFTEQRRVARCRPVAARPRGTPGGEPPGATRAHPAPGPPVCGLGDAKERRGGGGAAPAPPPGPDPAPPLSHPP